MGRRSKHRKQPESNIAPLEQTGPKPIKVLAIGIGVLLIIVAAANLLVGSFASGSVASGSIGNSASANQALGGTLAPISDGVQEVAISMQGSRYQPYPIRVKVGVPVRFTVDLNTVRGCYRSILIPGLGVSGRVATGSNTLEFTPSKAGTFRMTCGMGMADGQIIVEDANGQAPAPTAQAALLPVGGGSCDAGGGGCGCGGG